jgi:nicotinic acid phosphoribosyltransferase
MSFSNQQQPFKGTTAQQRAVEEVDYALKIESLREEIDLFFSSKLDVIRQNPFIVDFFKTMKNNLVDYHVDHLSRIEFNANLVKLFDELFRVLSLFTYDPTGNLVPIMDGIITGTTHNDYYKLTMAPVIAWAESVMSGPVNVCFGTDIREILLAKKLLENHNGIRFDVINALNDLAGRRFNPDIVKQAVSGKSIQGFWDQHSERIFGTPESPNTLVRPFRPEGANPSDFHGDTVIYKRQLTPDDVTDGGVALTVYVGQNAKSTIDPTQPPMKVYIEAMGPWGRVSYLETTMMQAVYAVALQHHLREQQKSYGQWLYEAMFRCHLSMRHTQIECPNISGALFSGRRTGHHALTLLQVLYLSRFQTGEGGVGKCIGTSSVDAWYTLVHQFGFRNIVPPVGTHAHELSMVFASLFPQLDKIKEGGVPFSQALSHALYYTLVHQGHSVPMPMLPDTLGTPACLIALASCWVQKMENGAQTKDTIRLLSVMTSARQDSGSLADFKALMDIYKTSSEGLMNKKLGMMASEIDDKGSMKCAHSLGYGTYGTGGYMGDSEKAWSTTETKFSASMAVKAVRVFVGLVKQKSPIKLGDSNDTLKTTGDTSMEPPDYLEMIQDADKVKQTAIQMVQLGCLVSHNQPFLWIIQETGEVVIYLNGTEIGRLTPRC